MSLGGRLLVPRRAQSVLIASVVTTAIVAAVLGIFLPQPPVTIHVRWAPHVSEPSRSTLETRFDLRLAEQMDARTWRYVLGNASTRTIRTIVLDPAVEDTAHVNRRWYRPSLSSDRLRLIILFSLLAGLAAVPLVALLEATRWLLQRGSRWHRWALVAAIIVGATIGMRVWQMPMQVTDSLIPMLQAQAAPGASPVHFLNETAFLRPLYWSQIKALLGPASRTSYHHVFKGMQVMLVLMLFVGVWWVARVRSLTDFTAFVFALLVMVGMPTFTGLVAEAYPINHYLEMAVACVAALALVQGRRHRWSDAAALALFAGAVFTLESGLLVMVVLVAGRLVGWTGVSRRALVGVAAIACAYFYFRTIQLSTGMPDFGERATGFGFSRMEPADTVALFSGREYLLYAYNVASSLLSLLLAEPRNGQFVAMAAWVGGDLRPVHVVTIVASLMATSFIVRFLIARLRARQTVGLDDHLRMIVVAGAVAAGNAAFCLVYVKDEIMSTAGVFYALAVYTAVRGLLVDLEQRPFRPVAAATAAVLLLAAGAAWDMRVMSLHYRLYETTIVTRGEWADVNRWLDAQRALPLTRDGEVMVQTLALDAARTPVRLRQFAPVWTRWLD